MLWHRKQILVAKYIGTHLRPSEGSPQICTEVGESEFFNHDMQTAAVRLIQGNEAAEVPCRTIMGFQGSLLYEIQGSCRIRTIP